MPRTIAAILLSGLLYGASFPLLGLSALAWVSLVPLLWLLRQPGVTAFSAFRAGLFSALIGNLYIYIWVWPTFEAARINPVTTFTCWILLSVVVALYTGGFAVAYQRLPGGLLRPWTAAALWVVLDEIRSVVFTGFPWALLSHTQVERTALIQVAAIAGAPAITFLIVLVNVAIAEVVSSSREKARRPLVNAAAAAVIVLATAGWGLLRLRVAEGIPSRTLGVTLLQGNIDQYQKWDDKYEEQIRLTYADLARRSAREATTDLIVWPESALPTWFPAETNYLFWMTDLVGETKVPHLFGSLFKIGDFEQNSAFLMRPGGKFDAPYSKRHLVPFGEYVPAAGLLSRVVPYLGQVGTFSAGIEPKIFEVNGIKLSPNICYEAMFPALVRESAQNADVIVNLTNDGWFLNSGAPRQHFAVNILRAVENNRPVIRAANSGISALIDNYGRIVVRTELMETVAVTDALPVPPFNHRSLYGLVGNWFGWLCAFVVLAAFAAPFVRRRATPTETI